MKKLIPLFSIIAILLAPSPVAAQGKIIHFQTPTTTVGEALKAIEQQSGLSIVYNETQIDLGRQLGMSGDYQLEDALKTVFDGRGAVHDGHVLDL